MVRQGTRRGPSPQGPPGAQDELGVSGAMAVQRSQGHLPASLWADGAVRNDTAPRPGSASGWPCTQISPSSLHLISSSVKWGWGLLNGCPIPSILYVTHVTSVKLRRVTVGGLSSLTGRCRSLGGMQSNGASSKGWHLGNG